MVLQYDPSGHRLVGRHVSIPVAVYRATVACVVCLGVRPGDAHDRLCREDIWDAGSPALTVLPTVDGALHAATTLLTSSDRSRRASDA
jgi:hypothetical protein